MAKRIDLRRLGMAGLVALALTMIGFGLARAKTGDDNAQQLDTALEQLLPSPGALVLRQSQVGIDLIPGWTGFLTIDGKQIPEDQLFRDEALNQVFYTPREGAEIEEFEPGAHTIVATFWAIADGEQTAHHATWRFNVS